MSVTGKAPPPMWRSFAERDDATADAGLRMLDEFPGLAARMEAGLDRRTALKFMGAALALGGLSACSAPKDEILPYIDQPEGLIPGIPQFYATTLLADGFGIGALVESHEGRPTKVEGNPDHPASRGATDAVMQAACLDLFDPERSRVPLRQGQPASQAAVDLMLAELHGQLKASGGRRTAVLTGASTSPTVDALLGTLARSFPGLRHFRHLPLGEPAVDLCGTRAVLRPRLDAARVILSLDADFLGDGPGKLAHARDFAARRRVAGTGAASMNRLYAIESTPTVTGASADHRWALRLDAMAAVLRALAVQLAGGAPPADAPLPPDIIAAIADDLRQAGGEALILPGPHLPGPLQVLAMALNDALGATGRAVEALPQDRFSAATQGDLADLVTALQKDSIDALVILESNPAYTGTRDLDVNGAFSRARLRVHLGTHADETAGLCDWHIPAAHVLESWGDARAFDGTASLIQPLIQPLYNGRTSTQLLAALAGTPDPDARRIVADHWTDRGLTPDAWRVALRKGVIEGVDAARVAPTTLNCGTIASALAAMPVAAPAAKGLHLRFAPDPFLRDGSFATNAWLQELPRPLTKIVWGNAAAIAPATARRLGIDTGTMVALAVDGHSIDIPVWVQPGHPEDSLTVNLGYGRRIAGEIASGLGANAYRLRTQDGFWGRDGVEIAPSDRQGDVITLQHHQRMEGRAPVRPATLADFQADADVIHDGHPPPPNQSIYQEWDYPGNAWGMVIDPTVCIGCNACVAACQAENNIPSVGPEECDRGHEMHWLRVDRYYAGPEDAPETYFQPVPCMHCEKAPCELVCPVNATVHTHDGLNAQVYNRCIGTRYCSQNCPYKVRRFNFHLYQPFGQGRTASAAPVMNPDVSVRSRGVMEKCTYCVQRISAARITADIEGRPIADGDVVTACQQACPTQAIQFGDLNDKGSAVRGLRDDPLNYALLGHLNTRPRTTYLGRLSNPNPALATEADDD